MLRRFKKGQSTLEYVIILAAVVGAIILISAYLKTHLGTTYNTMDEKMSQKIGSVTF